jgi:hypothetical protein
VSRSRMEHLKPLFVRVKLSAVRCVQPVSQKLFTMSGLAVDSHTLKPGDGKELLDLCERIRTRVARETKRRVEIVSCYEAGYDGFWLHRLLEAHGIRHQGSQQSLDIDVVRFPPAAPA